jgi:hypothetical protein
MRQDLKVKTKCKRYVMFAISTAVLAATFASTAKGQVSTKLTNPPWTITVVATGSNERPHYTVSPPADSGACYDDENTTPTAKILTVCAGDTISWVAKTTSAQPKMYLFHEERYLFDSNSVPAQGFEAVGGLIKAKVDPNATEGDEHKYYVSVYDDVSKRLYVDDPKIMIGTGSRIRLEDQIKQDCRTLTNLPDGSESTKNVIIGCHEILEGTQKHPAAPAK